MSTNRENRSYKPSPSVFPSVSLCLSTITSWSFCFSSSLMPRLFTEGGEKWRFLTFFTPTGFSLFDRFLDCASTVTRQHKWDFWDQCRNPGCNPAIKAFFSEHCLERQTPSRAPDFHDFLTPCLYAVVKGLMQLTFAELSLGKETSLQILALFSHLGLNMTISQHAQIPLQLLLHYQSDTGLNNNALSLQAWTTHAGVTDN